MPALYAAAPTEVLATMRNVIDELFPDISANDLSIYVQIASAEEGEPAVKLHGSPALAKIKVVSAEDRSSGGSDVKITVDFHRYQKLRPRQREAMFAHELRHIVFIRDDDTNAVKLDDYGRPRVKLRPDDYAITGFRWVVERFGDDSIEQDSYERLGRFLGERQSEFGFIGDDSGTDPGPTGDELDEDEGGDSLPIGRARRA